MTIDFRDNKLILDKEKAIFLPELGILAISDLHLGKAAYFRKAGIQVPSAIANQDILRLTKLIDQYQPKEILINGDMLHADLNSDIDHFAKWKEAYHQIKFSLVLGNHDRLSKSEYQTLGITTYNPSFSTSTFCFIHDALKCSEANLYPISGHIHPGISMVGKAKQRLKFPCFYFGENYALMPAFSVFTGLGLIKPKTGEQVYAITPSKVVKV